MTSDGVQVGPPQAGLITEHGRLGRAVPDVGPGRAGQILSGPVPGLDRSSKHGHIGRDRQGTASGRCEKREKSWWWGPWRRKVFFQEGQIVNCSRWRPKSFFQGGAIMVEFHFTNSKLREKHFSIKRLIGKYRISKSRRAHCPPFRRPCWEQSNDFVIDFTPLGGNFLRALELRMNISTRWRYWVSPLNKNARQHQSGRSTKVPR